MKYPPKPCLRKPLILFSLLTVSGKHHFHLCPLSSSDLIFFFFLVQSHSREEGGENYVKGKRRHIRIFSSLQELT